MPIRVAVCVSGRGSNLEALFQALAKAEAPASAEIVLVLSDRADAGGLAHATGRGVATEVLADPASAAMWLDALHRHHVDLVVLAGYLKLVPGPVITEFRGRVVNVHPSLLPAFGGRGMYGHRVHQAVLASGARESGATVHLVDEVYDRGAILAQARVPVRPNDTAESLAARVLEAEHGLLPGVVLLLAAALRAGRDVLATPSLESPS